MGKSRLEAFSDGVLAIIITIMVLELKIPHGEDLAALTPVAGSFASYVISFVYVGIYWNNHHHLMHAVVHVDGWIMWANMHLLFWLSLVPATTAWIGETTAAPVPTAAYGVVLFMAGIAWLLLQRAIIRHHGKDSTLATAIGRDLKGKVSGVSYLAAIGLALVQPWIAVGIYIALAILWVIPDRRISRTIEHHH